MTAIRQTKRLFLILFCAILIMGSLQACKKNEQNVVDKHIMKQTDVVAGHGEKTFTERYGLSFQLPMPEDKFMDIVDQLKLHHQSCGKKGIGVGLPVPRHTPTVDLSRAQECIEIIGRIDSARHIGERYRAFVDSKHQVFYIENAYSYTGP